MSQSQPPLNPIPKDDVVDVGEDGEKSDDGSRSSKDRPARRTFLRAATISGLGAIAYGGWNISKRYSGTAALRDAKAGLEDYLTKPDDFFDVSRGVPAIRNLPMEKKVEVGLTRETWQLEIDSDPDHPADIEQPMTKKAGTAFSFSDLMELAKTRSVRFPKLLSCLNIGDPLGMGIWEGVPVRDVLWKVRPQRNLRRVIYYCYHNDNPKQMFKSSLPVGRVLEDLFGLPPVILCYKLNGQWLTPRRGAPVRLVVPEAYGFKSVKWLTNLVLSNRSEANDTYALGNNDIDSHMKSFAGVYGGSREVAANKPFPVVGFAQSGISGVSKVQVFTRAASEEDVDGKPSEPLFENASWVDAEILPPPENWGGGLETDSRELFKSVMGFSSRTGRPLSWPMRLTKLHWAYLHPGLPPGKHYLRSRTIDENGAAQPMPRPFLKSGFSTIKKFAITASSS